MLRSTRLSFLTFLFGLAAIAATNSHGQSVVSGIVQSEDEKLPLPRASVRIGKSTTLTDEVGRFQFRIQNISQKDTLVVTYVGYEPKHILLSDSPINVDLSIILKKSTIVLNEVSVHSAFWTQAYSPKELKEDCDKFYYILEKVHTGLFDYLSPARWQELKDSTYALIREPMSQRDFYQLIALQVSSIRNRHTKHGVTDRWYRQKQNIFPFNVRYFGDRMFISESFLPEHSFPRGTEILSINGRTPSEIRSMIWRYISADGYNETGKATSLDDYFPWYHALFVEEAKSFDITLKTTGGLEQKIITAGLEDSFRHFSFQQVQRRMKTSLELDIDKSSGIAYFRIEDSRVFTDSLRTYIQRIVDSQVRAIVIDLRGNGGMREEEQVAELYAYLVDKPFRLYERIEVKSNDTDVFDKDFTYKPYGRSIKHIRDEFYDKLEDSGQGYFLWNGEPYAGILKPAPVNLNATIYILVDGRNYSASTDFTSLASQLANVFIVGTETGGDYRSYVSGAMYGLVLPNSKIGVKVSTWKSVLAVPEIPGNRGHGVLPDYPVTDTLQDFVEGHDTMKAYVYELIRRQR